MTFMGDPGLKERTPSVIGVRTPTKSLVRLDRLPSRIPNPAPRTGV